MEKQMHLLISNMHCPSCVTAIADVLSSPPISLSQAAFSVSLLTGVLTLSTLPSTIPAIESALVEGGFEISHPDSSSSVASQSHHASPQDTHQSSSWFGFETKRAKAKRHERELARHSAREAAHISTCRACREGLAADAKGKEKEYVILLEKTRPETITTLAIGGMTCSSCVSNVSHIFSRENDERISKVDVTLLPGRAVIRHRGIGDAELVEMLEAGGYEGNVVESMLVDSEEADGQQERWLTTRLSIEGMTCASCIGSMDRILKDLPGVRSWQVTLLPAVATVVHDPNVLPVSRIIEEIEDGGYGAGLVSSSPIEASLSLAKSQRTIKVRVDGMFCDKCSTALNTLLSSLRADSSLTSFTPLSLSNPVTTLTYTPSPPRGFTIRTLRSSVSSLGPFTMQPIRASSTLTELATKAQAREAKAILFRLIIAFVFAIPTFLIGIVFMSLLNDMDHLRVYFSYPIWGSASRGTIALFALSTPVQFGVGSLFYVRAWKSLRGVWRRKGASRWRDRALRWGSMDTLVALGTTAGWVSSVAFMAIDASVPAGPDKMSGEMGYFDSSVFLVLFILAGRALEAVSRRKTGEAVEKLGKMKSYSGILVTEENEDAQLDEKEGEHKDNQLSPVTSCSLDICEQSSASSTEVVDVDFLEVGDILLIPAGAAVPLDAVLLPTSSSSSFDESSLTGESHPVLKSPTDPVFSGSTNLGPSAVRVRVSTSAGDTLMDGIVSAVRDAMARKASIEKIADQVTGYFVPVVTGIACFTFCIWIMRGYLGNLPTDWLEGEEGRKGGWALFAVQFTVACLVVACPCGVGLSAPTAQMVGTGIAASLGIVPYGGGEAFQNATKIDCVVFDKTGTITLGNFKVSDYQIFPTSTSLPTGAIWKMIAVVEETSSHPISEGVREYCQTQPAVEVDVKCIHSEELPGRGLCALVSVDNVMYEVLAGNERLMEEKGSKFHEESVTEDQAASTSCLARWASRGSSIVFVALRAVTSGNMDEYPFSTSVLLAVDDPARPEASYVIKELEKQGIVCFMLTGDNTLTSKAVARQVGIADDRVFSGVLPVGKKDRIEIIQKGGASSAIAALRSRRPWWRRLFREKRDFTKARVLFVGDGINDIVALTQADVGVSMGTGASVALSSSDFCLLSSNLLSLLTLLSLSRATFNKILTNFGWAICFNAVLVPIAAGAFYDLGRTRLPPVWASLAMALSSVSVVTNSLLLRWTFSIPKAVSAYSTRREGA